MIAYPDIPQPSTNFSGRSETPVIRTDIETGLIVQEGRFSTGRETFNANWKLSNSELVIFENWFGETLAGGVLTFGLLLPEDDGYTVQPVRFVGGEYRANQSGVLFWDVSATLEKLNVSPAPANRTPAVSQWNRLAVDPTESQVLTIAHRGARLTVRPGDGSTTLLEIYPPTDQTQYLPIGINNQGDGETRITSEDVPPLPGVPVASWPGTLPGPNRAFAVAARRRALRLEMDSGHSRQYSGSSSVVKRYSVEWDFTLEQLQEFQEFFYVTLRAGSLVCNMTLPVDGLSVSVPVRFIGGTFEESYIFHDTFRVRAEVDRITNQIVPITEAQPFPLHYYPRVEVVENRKVLAGDAGKLFVVNPSAGQTINLHISTLNIEFGVLVIGLGDVLITRTPFIYSPNVSESAASGFGLTAFELNTTILDLDPISEDSAPSAFGKPSFELQTLIVELDPISEDSAPSSFGKPSLDLVEVLVDLGTINEDSAASGFGKPAFTLDVFP